jgi:hypothetical protein
MAAGPRASHGSSLIGVSRTPFKAGLTPLGSPATCVRPDVDRAAASSGSACGQVINGGPIRCGSQLLGWRFRSVRRKAFIMRKSRYIAVAVATLTLGATGAASASALTHAPSRAAGVTTLRSAHPNLARVTARSGPRVTARSRSGTAASAGCGFVKAVPFDRFNGISGSSSAGSHLPGPQAGGLIALSGDPTAGRGLSASDRDPARARGYSITPPSFSKSVSDGPQAEPSHHL